MALEFANHHSQHLLNPSRQSGEEREEGQEDQKDGEALRGEERGLWVFPSRRWPCEVNGGRREGKRSCWEREQGEMACVAGPWVHAWW